MKQKVNEMKKLINKNQIPSPPLKGENLIFQYHIYFEIKILT